MTPWLSILIPVYNVENYLTECVNSVLSQIDEQIEIITLDDQSTDNSFKLLNTLAAQSAYPITVLQHDKNAGLSAARNTMIDAASGDYLWFLDSDDALSSGAIQQLKSLIAAHSPDLIICDYEIWREQPSKKMWRQQDTHVRSLAGPENQLLCDSNNLFAHLFTQGKLHAWSKISKRSLWKNKLRFPIGKYYEDMATTPQLAFQAKNYLYSAQVWIKYRQRSGSILATPSLNKIDDMINALIPVLPYWSQKQPPLRADARFAFMVYCCRIYQFALKDLQRIHKKESMEKQSINKYSLREKVYTAAQLSRPEFAWEFIKRGKLIRLIRFLR